MITLYHGGAEIITTPEIRKSNRTLDFGSGFYLTSSMQQAKEWVLRHLETTGIVGYVNIYHFPETETASTLKIKTFASASEDWLDFVMSNRRIPGFTHDYDIIIGPVANDRVYTAFSLYEGGVIDKATLIHELKTYRLVDQYLFHTPEALKHLHFQSAKPVQR